MPKFFINILRSYSMNLKLLLSPISLTKCLRQDSDYIPIFSVSLALSSIRHSPQLPVLPLVYSKKRNYLTKKSLPPLHAIYVPRHPPPFPINHLLPTLRNYSTTYCLLPSIARRRMSDNCFNKIPFNHKVSTKILAQHHKIRPLTT